MLPFIIIVTLSGLLIGSFLNVLIHRLPRDESVVSPPSHCPHCRHRLGVWDLIPILSYLFLRGHCRYCGEKISPRYPLVELLTGAAFLLVFLQYGFSLTTLAGWILTSVLISCAFIDLDHGIIPNLITYPALIIGLLLSWWTIGWQSAGLGVLLFAGLLLLIVVLSRGGMGGGDVKLAAVIGAFAGLPGAICGLFIASVTGGLWGVYLLATKKAQRGTAIRFGPFLALGGWIGMAYGEELLAWYLRLFV